MREPLYPIDEQQRLAALHGLHVLDTPPDERFDRITRCAQRLFDVPIALISLIDANRQWFKSCQGLSVAETPRSISFCGHAILQDNPLVIPDALQDARFADNPLVTGEPHIRFYAGYPLRHSNGAKLGTLCLIDRRPRTFDEHDLAALSDLGAWAESELNRLSLAAIVALKEKSEAQLRDVTKLQQAILNGANFTIISTDTNGIIHTFNAAAQQWLGYAEEDIIGKVTPAIIHDPGEVVARARKLSKELGVTIEPGFEVFVAKARLGIPDENEWTYIRKDGSRFPVLLSVTALRDKNGDVTGFIGIGSDITERKRVERLKSEFISTVSHELRTPLTSIQGSLGLITGGMMGDLPEQVKFLMDIAYKNTDRLGRLVNDILDMEKIESGKVEITLKPVQIMPLLEQTLEANKSYGAQLHVRFALSDALPDVMVLADGDRLVQVLTNLLSNAAKFSPAHDVVNISVRRSDESVRVAVSDHGPGIPEDFKGRIFQKFSQADSSDSRRTGGSGLGLSISQALMERMGGGIGFEARPGGGTTFYVDLPEWRERRF